MPTPGKRSAPESVRIENVTKTFRDPATGDPVTLVPCLATGATDARMYERVCDSCLRFSAFVTDDDETDRGVHGTDERIMRRAYLQGIRTFVRLIEETCVRP